MPPQGTPEPASGLSLPDVLHAIFKHKWKIVAGILLGLAAGGGFYLLAPSQYQSQAKLLVRYVKEKSEVDEVDKISPSGPVRGGNGAMGAELELMTSADLAAAVVDGVGLERFKKRDGTPMSRSEAVGAIRAGTEATLLKGTSVIAIRFAYHDREMSTVILREFVNTYLEMHLKMHRAVGGYDFVTQQTARVKTRLTQIEEELKRLKSEANVISLPDSTSNLNAALAKVQDELNSAVTVKAETEARVQALEQSVPAGEKTGAAADKPAPVAAADVQKYQAITTQLAQLRQGEFQLLSQYNADARPVRLHRAQMADLESQQREMEKRFPALVALAPTSSSGQPLDLAAERVRLIAVDARIESLNKQLTGLQERARQLADVGPRIAQLEVQRTQAQQNYIESENRLERAQIDEALDPANMPNINTLESPTSVGQAADQTQKIALGIFGGLSSLGIGYALLSGLLLDRTIKRSAQLETLLRLPVLLSIPFAKPEKGRRLLKGKRAGDADSSKALAANGSGSSNGAAIAPWESTHFIRPFAEEVRDRLSVFFDLYNILHKPKLVAVTGIMEGAGATTLAAGLAASLSETGEGKVLLVDMCSHGAVVHPYLKGQRQIPLTSALKPDENAKVPESENLYLATTAQGNEQIEQLGARRFNELVPRLLATDYDYIVFDMPDLARTSATLAMARHMDLVLLLVEAECTTADAVRRTWNDLAGAKANVSVIFNKARNYAPAWLQG